MIDLVQVEDGVTFSVRVVPRASRSEIAGEHDGALRVRLAAAPVDGAANDELAKLLANHLGVAKGRVSLIGGHMSRSKKVHIADVTLDEIRAVFERKMQGVI